MKTESDFTKMLCERIKRAGGHVMPMVGSNMQPSGYPDRYIAHPRFTGWLEMKKDDRQLTGEQRGCMVRLVARGVPAFTVRWHSKIDLVSISAPYGGAGASCELYRHPVGPFLKTPLLVLATCSGLFHIWRNDENRS